MRSGTGGVVEATQEGAFADVGVVGQRPDGQIITQVFNVFGLPLVVLSFFFLWNRKNVGLPSKRIVTNVILLGAFLFSIIISGNALIDILDL